MIITLAEYKEFKGITSALPNETQINLIIQVVTDRIEKHCNVEFLNPDSNIKMIAVNMVDSILLQTNGITTDGGNNNITSQSFEGNSVSFANTNTLLNDLINSFSKELGKYRKMFKEVD